MSPFEIHFLSSAVTGRLLMNSARMAMKKQFVAIFFSPQQSRWNSMCEAAGVSNPVQVYFASRITSHPELQSGGWVNCEEHLALFWLYVMFLLHLIAFFFTPHINGSVAVLPGVVWSLTWLRTMELHRHLLFSLREEEKNKADNDTRVQSTGSTQLALCRAWAQV